MITIGYDDFLRLCRVDNPMNIGCGFRMKSDGVWVDLPPDDVALFFEERATLSEHPCGDLSKPALALPCSLEEFKAFILWGGLNGIIDQRMLDSIINNQETPEQLVSRMQAIGKSNLEIARELVGMPGGLTDHRLGSLLPANPGTHVSPDAKRKQGTRLRSRLKNNKN